MALTDRAITNSSVFSLGNKDVQVGCDHELCEAISCATLVVCCCVAVWGTHGVGSK